MNTKGSEHDWLQRLAHHRLGLASMSLAESTLVPIPLETVMAPLMVGHPARALAIAFWVWLGCLAGAGLFFLVGQWALDPLVLPALAVLGLAEDFRVMTDELGQEGFFWSVFLVSFAPAPMQLATLGAGAAGGNMLVFFAAIALSRGLRYGAMALLAQFVGPRVAAAGLPARYSVPGMILLMLLIWAAWRCL